MIDNLEALVSDCIQVDELFYQDGFPIIRGRLLMEASKVFEIICERLKPFNLIPILRILRSPRRMRGARDDIRDKDGKSCQCGEPRQSGEVELQVRAFFQSQPTRVWLNCVLLLVTICSTILAGSFLAGVDPFIDIKNLLKGIPFSITLLLILGAHEFGHYFACKLQGIQATLPYFIPAPPPIFPLGTFGAVIRIKSPIKDKKSLVKIGAMGPIIGFCVAIPIVIIGLKLSKFALLSPTSEHIFLGNSIVFWALTNLFTNSPPIGYDLSLHPVAFAGWVGMFVTAINLLPVGQLDGGHISYALLGNNFKFITFPIIGIMILCGLFFWPGWLFWAILIVAFIGLRHPPPLNDITPLDRQHKFIGIGSMFIFIITFVPIPFKV